MSTTSANGPRPATSDDRARVLQDKLRSEQALAKLDAAMREVARCLQTLRRLSAELRKDQR